MQPKEGRNLTKHGVKKMIEQLDPAKRATSKQVVLQVVSSPTQAELGEQGTQVMLSDGYSKIGAILPPKVALVSYGPA